MAGSYLDPPGHRMAYDRDGSAVFYGSTAMTTQSYIERLNNETNQQWGGPNGVTVGVIFPELRDVVAVIGDLRNSGLSSFSTSVDTTNGTDGTWVGRGNPGNKFKYAPNYRTPSLVNWPGVKAVRMSPVDSGKQVWGLHIYGTPSASDKHLDFFDTASVARVTSVFFDLGDVTLGATITREFRIKNRSAILTANGVVLRATALTDSSPTYAGQWEFSTDGATFFTTVNLGDLAPGAVSGIVTARIIPQSGIGLWAQRLHAEATSWT
jgi:hypothetical protein